MAQGWERSPFVNESRVRFPEPAPYVGSVCCWFSSILEFFPGSPVFLPPQKSTLLNSISIWKQW